MKTIALDNKEEWLIDFDYPNNHEKIVYACSLDIYQGDMIWISTNSSCEIEVSVNHKISVPNLKYILLDGEESLAIYRNLMANFKSQPSIEAFSFSNTKITQIPDFVLNSKNLIHLTLRSERELSKLPSELFDLVNLEMLSFAYTKNITTIPDDIAQLINLKYFDLWSANIDYLSDQLLLLPKIKKINLAYSTYTPTNEILKALKVFEKKGGSFGGYTNRL